MGTTPFSLCLLPPRLLRRAVHGAVRGVHAHARLGDVLQAQRGQDGGLRRSQGVAVQAEFVKAKAWKPTSES
jgi:hypothetical protein